jgi:glutathione S-transferase
MTYELWYWPGIPGRGEFIRLFMEAVGIPYRDCARKEGAEALVKDMAARPGIRPFAPPYIVDENGLVLAQVAHILSWLTDRHGLGTGDLPTDLHLIQLQLTVTDVVAEVHNVHHPIAAEKYYHEQHEAALAAAGSFVRVRMPKYLRYFERALGCSDGPFMAGDRWSHVDTSLFQLVEGLTYAFPLRMAALRGDYPCLHAVRDAVAALPGVASYLASSRREPFNEEGIFRHYPELDAA